MANIFSRLFGSEKKDTTYQGPKPYGSLLDATGGKDYYGTLNARIAGQGTGYSSGYVDKATNPVIARMRNQFNSYDLPELKSELSATGRRAGSAGFGQISKAYENQGLNEEAAYAPIYAANEEAKRSDTNDAITKLGAFNTGDFNARNTLAGFENANNNRQVQEDAARRAAEATGLQNSLNYAQDSVGILYGGDGAFKRSPSVNYGGVNYATSQPPIGQQDYYSQMLSRLPSKQGQTRGAL